MPRETVRRKLAALKAKGWIASDERGNYVATATASSELEPLTATSIGFIARMHDTVADISR
jgi:DNA-binding IclR family transcriptional regulator